MKKIVAITLALILCLSLAACGQSTSVKSTKPEVNDAVAAKYDSDGIAYIPLMDGNIAKIDDEVFRASVTPDRKHIVVLTLDGVLYYTGADQAEKTQISEKGNAISAVADEGILYQDADNNYHRFLFADGSDVNIGKVTTYKRSTNGLHIAFETNSAVYILYGNAQEKEKLGNVTNSCKILYVSDDGKTVYWNDYKNYEETIFASVNGEKTKVGTFDTSSKYVNTSVTHNETEKYAVFTNIYSDVMYVVPENGEPLKIKLGHELASSRVYTKSGLLRKDTSSAFPGIYVSVEGSDGNNLYYIDAEGEKEKVLSEIGSYTIYDNTLYYVDEDGNLKIAKIEDATLTNEEKVTGDVEILDETKCIDGYIFFVKDYFSKDSTGILYAYKKGSDPVKITSDVFSYKDFGYIVGTNSPDGKTIYFYKDLEEISGTYSSSAVLYKYTYGDSEPTRIASDVVVGTIDSGYTTGLINNNSFIYFKYSSVKDEEIIGDWFFFNGTDSKQMATDVKG